MRKGINCIMETVLVNYAYIIMVLTFCLISSVYAGRTDESGFGVHRTSQKLAQPGIIKSLTGANKGNALDIARSFIKQSGRSQGLTSLDISDMIVTDQYVSKNTGITHIYFRQRKGGIEVFNATININVGNDGSVINMGNSFFPNLNNAINTTVPTLSAIQAVELAARHLGLSIVKPLVTLKKISGTASEVVISDGGISQKEIPAKLMFQPVGEREVRLVWDIEIYDLGSNHYWSLRVDTETGEVLSQVDFIDSAVDSFY